MEVSAQELHSSAEQMDEGRLVSNSRMKVVLKVVVIGEQNSGKTALISRFAMTCKGLPPPSFPSGQYCTTAEVTFTRAETASCVFLIVSPMQWEVGGSPILRTVEDDYIKAVDAVLVVCMRDHTVAREKIASFVGKGVRAAMWLVRVNSEALQPREVHDVDLNSSDSVSQLFSDLEKECREKNLVHIISPQAIEKQSSCAVL